MLPTQSSAPLVFERHLGSRADTHQHLRLSACSRRVPTRLVRDAPLRLACAPAQARAATSFPRRVQRPRAPASFCQCHTEDHALTSRPRRAQAQMDLQICKQTTCCSTPRCKDGGSVRPRGGCPCADMSAHSSRAPLRALFPADPHLRAHMFAEDVGCTALNARRRTRHLTRPRVHFRCACASLARDRTLTLVYFPLAPPP